jgi:hypothetical protein
LSVRNFLHGYGEIDLKGGFTSPRLVIEAMKRSFRIRVLEESPGHIKCKIYRFVRLSGFPVIFPNPTIEIDWRQSPEGCLIEYCLTCYDYYLVAALAFIFGVGCSNMEHALWASLRAGVLGAGAVLFLSGGLVFADTKYLVRRIRKALLELTV